MDEYKEQLKQMDSVGLTHVFEMIIEDLLHPFKDPRERHDILRNPLDQKFPSKELFYCLINENERTFRPGNIVSATVFRTFESRDDQPPRVVCRLENGMEANIGP